MLKPISAALVSFLLTLVASAQTSTAAHSANDSTKAFRTIDSHKGNSVSINPTTDWSRYAEYRFTPASYQPSNARPTADRKNRSRS